MKQKKERIFLKKTISSDEKVNFRYVISHEGFVQDKNRILTFSLVIQRQATRGVKIFISKGGFSESSADVVKNLGS